MNWSCTRCSFSNHPDLHFCEICEHRVDSDSAKDNGFHTATSGGTQEVITLFSPGDETKKDSWRNNNERIPHTELESTLFENHMEILDSPSSIHQKSLNPLLSIKSCSHSTPDIIQLIQQLKPTNTSRNKKHDEYVVCSPPCLHVSQKKAYGSAWSCGYRNIQMLCSSLMHIAEYRRVLFDGTGAVPEICAIQRWIETAWKAGFDTEGAEQLNHRLLGSSKWIGATECAALLRYFGIRAVIVDFPEVSSPVPRSSSTGSSVGASGSTSTAIGTENGVSVTGKRPFESMEGTNSGSSGNHTSDSSVMTMSNRLVGWAERYYTQANTSTSSTSGVGAPHTTDGEGDDYFKSTFLPPLYFQHQGHSRTIVGLQYSTPAPSPATTSSTSTPARCLEQLLIFNPSSDATSARESLLQDNMRWRTQICKHRASFKEDNYQLVYVAPGIMSEAERLRARVLVGTHESAILPVTL